MQSSNRADPSAKAPRAHRRLPIGLLAAWCLAPPMALAQAVDGLGFEQARALAAARAPMLLARQASLDAAAQMRIGADQLPDPKLTVGIDNYPVGGPDRYTLTGEAMTQRSIGWMQDVPNAAKRAARVQAADARTARERALLEAERLAIRREVAQAWLARHFAERRLAVFGTLEDENRLLRDTVGARVAGGKAMPADATMARQDALMLADRRDEIVRERAQAQATLVRWLGADAEQPLAGGVPALPVDRDAVLRGVERHADVLGFDPMRRMTDADAQEIEAAKRGDWGWQVAYSKRGPSYGDMVSFQFTFELPVAPGQRQDPQIAAKRKEAERIAAEREDLVRRRREELEQQLAELDELARKRERLVQASVPLADERVALAMAAYESARGDLAAVLAARRERAELALRAIELDARQQALRARLNDLIAE